MNIHLQESGASVHIGERLHDESQSIVDIKDQQLAEERLHAYSNLPVRTRVGDWIEINNKMRRIAYIWPEGVQWTDAGSFYLGSGGLASMSGGLEDTLPHSEIFDGNERKMAQFWFFHHNSSGAHRGVQMEMPIRVWKHRSVDGRKVLSTREWCENNKRAGDCLCGMWIKRR